MQLTADGRALRVRYRDIAERRAYLRCPPEARARLAKLAGAPWNPQDPNAELSQEQEGILAQQARIKCIEAGTGAGKSMMSGIEVACELMIPFSQVGVLGDRYDHVGKEFRYAWLFITTLFRGRMSLFPRCQCLTQPPRHEYHIQTLWNSWALGCSMDSQEGAAVLGETLNLAVLCEGSQISTRVLNRRILRATDRAVVKRVGFKHPRETGRLVAFTTPDQLEGAASELIEQRVKLTRGKLERLAYGRVSWEDSFWALRGAASTMNPGFSETVLEMRKKTMSDWEFNEVYGGVASPASGRVYAHWNERKHMVRMPSVEALRGMRLGLGIDTGDTLAAILVGLDPVLKTTVLGEHFGRKQTIQSDSQGIEHMLLQALEPLGYKTLAQCLERLDLAVIDPSSPFKIDLMDNLPGLDLSNPFRDEGSFDLLPTVFQVHWLIQNDRLHVEEHCENLLEEFRKWIWQSQRSPARKGHYFERKPIKDFDHGLDAMRYITLSLLTMGPLEIAAAQSNFRDTWNRRSTARVGGELLELLQEAEDSGGIWSGR